MKISEDEREAAYELRWMIEQILFERERASLYREIYMIAYGAGAKSEIADAQARTAIRNMEKAFEPVCEQCQEEADHGSAQAKAN